MSEDVQMREKDCQARRRMAGLICIAACPRPKTVSGPDKHVISLSTMITIRQSMKLDSETLSQIERKQIVKNNTDALLSQSKYAGNKRNYQVLHEDMIHQTRQPGIRLYSEKKALTQTSPDKLKTDYSPLRRS
jgi:hypothetical protein